MRRFVDTLAGKALCHLAVMALVLPTVTLGVTAKASARQVTQLPTWAVTEFKDLKGNASLKYGQAAADAVSSELAKTNRYDVVPQDTVKRAIETLQLTSPPEGLVNLSRIGQEVVGPGRTGTIVEGQILDYRVQQVGSGKQAIVALRMVGYDVASGLPVNGALEKGESTVRPNSATNDALISDAIAQAAAVGVRTMQGQQLPSATVLNTTTRQALINQGTRSGFKTGDTVIITRGNEQVGTGRIGVIEPDQAEMTIERFKKGVAPGDRVRAVFSPPALPVGPVFADNGGLKVSNKTRRSGGSNNATLISALLVVGLIAVLLSNNNSNSTSATAGTTAEATIDTDNISPAVRVSWRPNGFFKGTGVSGTGVARWQIYRTGVSQNNPVLVLGNSRNFGVDSSRQDNSEFPNQSLQTNRVGGTTCDYQSPFNTARTAPTPLTVGTPYTYSVEAVYQVSGLDLPTPPGTTSGGTANGGTANGGTANGGTANGGTANGGTANGGTANAGGSNAGQTSAGNNGGGTNNGGGGTTGNNSLICYFQSGRSYTGQATPLNRPSLGGNLGSFDQGASIRIEFNSNQGVGAITPEYVIEFSNDPSFNPKFTVRTTANTTSVPIQSNSSLFDKKGLGGVNLRTAPRIYYRVGVRNTTDRPGPVKDSLSGQRYIYSLPSANNYFERNTGQIGG